MIKMIKHDLQVCSSAVDICGHTALHGTFSWDARGWPHFRQNCMSFRNAAPQLWQVTSCSSRVVSTWHIRHIRPYPTYPSAWHRWHLVCGLCAILKIFTWYSWRQGYFANQFLFRMSWIVFHCSDHLGSPELPNASHGSLPRSQIPNSLWSHGLQRTSGTPGKDVDLSGEAALRSQLQRSWNHVKETCLNLLQPAKQQQQQHHDQI